MNKSQVIVITGASAGVGRATALAFARQGARIGIIARGRDGLEAARHDGTDARAQHAAVFMGEKSPAAKAPAGAADLSAGSRRRSDRLGGAS